MSNPFEQIMSNPELFKVASTHHFHGNECLCGFVSPVSRQRTEHIMTETIAAALPEVTSVDELDQLPVGTVVYAANHIGPAEKFAVGCMGCGNNAAWSSALLARDGLPARVLYRPEVKP